MDGTSRCGCEENQIHLLLLTYDGVLMVFPLILQVICHIKKCHCTAESG